MTRLLLCGLALVAACTEPVPDRTGTGSPSGTTVGTLTGTPGGSTATGTPTGTTSTTEPWLLDVDCTQLLPLPLEFTTFPWVPSHEDFTFGPGNDGRYWGTAAGHLKATPYGGGTEIVVPGVGDARGTRFLADGTLVMAIIDSQSLVRVDPSSGSITQLVPNLPFPNGIAIGADGKAYVATSGQIVRVDPDTGDVEVVADMPNNSFDGLTFSHDYSRLYFNEELGQINWVDFDADGNPGPPVAGPRIPIGAFSILDGMTADACGNLYVVEMQGKLWRIDPNGNMEVAVDFAGTGSFLPAVNFGPDAGGWNPNAVYVQDFLGRVHEAVVGVPSKWEPHR